MALRFIYIGPFRFPDGDAAASRVLNNARILKKLDHEVKILSFGGRERSEDRCNNEYRYDGIPYVITHDIDTHSWRERFLRYIYPATHTWKILRSEVASYDVIISYNTTLAFNINLLKFCKRNHKKLILDITEWPECNEFLGGKLSPLYLMSEYNMRVVQKKIANIWPISKYLAHYYNKCHTLVLPPLISITDDKWTNNISIESLKIDSTCDLRLLFAGTPGRKDLLANLVQATTILLDYGHNVQLLVVGVNQDESTTYCDAEIIQKYPNNIAFLGRIPQSMVPSVYKLSDFSAIIREPNRKNTAGFPTKMAESMVAGCPVILTETSDLLDYAQDGINAILIPDSSINSIVTGLHRAINLSREDLNRMKREAKATGESFDFNQYVTDVDKFLLNLKKQ